MAEHIGVVGQLLHRGGDLLLRLHLDHRQLLLRRDRRWSISAAAHHSASLVLRVRGAADGGLGRAAGGGDGVRRRRRLDGPDGDDQPHRHRRPVGNGGEADAGLFRPAPAGHRAGLPRRRLSRAGRRRSSIRSGRASATPSEPSAPTRVRCRYPTRPASHVSCGAAHAGGASRRGRNPAAGCGRRSPGQPAGRRRRRPSAGANGASSLQRRSPSTSAEATSSPPSVVVLSPWPPKQLLTHRPGASSRISGILWRAKPMRPDQASRPRHRPAAGRPAAEIAPHQPGQVARRALGLIRPPQSSRPSGSSRK